jgi:hypothetical protein
MGGEYAGRPAPSPRRLRDGPAAAAMLAYDVLLGWSGGLLDPAKRPSLAFAIAVRRGGSSGGSTGGGAVSSSAGTGDFDFERSVTVPDARLSQLGLDFGFGFALESNDERAEVVARETTLSLGMGLGC